MPIPAQCQCGAKFAAPDHLAGKAVACPKCKQPLKIPAAAAVAGGSRGAKPAAAGATSAAGSRAATAKSAQPAAAKPTAATPAAAKQATAAKSAANGKIPVRCKCGASFAAPSNLAGKRVACPKCQQPVVIAAAGATAGRPASQPAAAAAADGGGRGGSIDDLLDEVGVEGKKVGDNYCPECGAEFAPEALLCVGCGYNRKSGRKLSTVTVKKPALRQLDTSAPGSMAAEASGPSRPLSVIMITILHFVMVGLNLLITALLVLGLALTGSGFVSLALGLNLLLVTLHVASAVGLILRAMWGWVLSLVVNGLLGLFAGINVGRSIYLASQIFTEPAVMEALSSDDPNRQAAAYGFMIGFSVLLVISLLVAWMYGAAVRALLSDKVRDYFATKPAPAAVLEF